ncbi:hypothetical protein M0Q50_05310 [bacterium]|jgi:hypothetical protein|nr:hypothetical protein [bacterium]
MGRRSSINKIKRDNSKSKNIDSALIMYLYEKQYPIISSHCSIDMLQESDILAISKSDYIYEFEVKISKADYKKDFIKEKHNNIINENATEIIKGEMTYILPNYFNYVVPANLITIDDLPEYAGLIYFNEDLSFDIIKKPKLIHKVKADEKFIRRLAHNLTCKLVFKKL